MQHDLTLAMLSWRQPRTLKHSLESYQRQGLLDMAKEKLIFFNECTGEDRRIAEKYGFTVLQAKRNIGIAKPFQELIKAASGRYFLFLENDFMLVEDEATCEQELQAAMAAVETDIACVRLRHQHHYGDPNYWLLKVWEGRKSAEQANLNATYLFNEPDREYDEIERVEHLNRTFFVADSGIANFTNNPCLYRTEFLREHFLQREFTEFDNLETNIEPWWQQAGLRIAQGRGLFKHHPLEVSGSGFAQHKRIKHSIKHWSHYLIRIGYKRRVINLFLLQFLPMLIKANINLGNKVMVNLSLGRYESE